MKKKKKNISSEVFNNIFNLTMDQMYLSALQPFYGMASHELQYVKQIIKCWKCKEELAVTYIEIDEKLKKDEKLSDETGLCERCYQLKKTKRMISKGKRIKPNTIIVPPLMEEEFRGLFKTTTVSDSASLHSVSHTLSEESLEAMNRHIVRDWENEHRVKKQKIRCYKCKELLATLYVGKYDVSIAQKNSLCKRCYQLEKLKE